MGQPAQQNVSLPHPSSSPHQSTILVVDDEQPSRTLCQEFLLADKYLIQTCSKPQEAIKLLTARRFDLLLVDLTIPNFDGIQFVKDIRYHYPHTSVLVMSAFGSVGTAVACMRAGAYDYITKPFPRDMLRGMVKRCLESVVLKREISKMQSELFKKDKLAAVGSMAGAIAHRMRNPLSIIQMCSQVLEKPFAKDKENLDVVYAIQEKVKTLEMLIRDFVEFSRASHIKKAMVQMESLADEVLTTVVQKCKIQKVSVIKNYQPRLPAINVDPDLIKEVLTNLIDNGLEAMKGPGKIALDIRYDESSKTMGVFVTNSGSVLPENLQEKIFEPFFTTKSTGMGLGLAIVRQVIEGHGGRIQAVGNPTGGVTTFSIYLPVKS